eukprot:FR736478.1.p1 GENE.FR736478.1~~FR736478.1.p1  ORF type:complete len:143 (+),score=4.72 FR736478.1:224-652(+)
MLPPSPILPNVNPGTCSLYYEGMGVVSASSGPGSRLAAEALTPVVSKEESLSDDHVSTGCDDHAYCRFCEHGCQESFGELSTEIYGDDLGDMKKLGRGPLAMTLLNNIATVCRVYYSAKYQNGSLAATLSLPEANDVAVVPG